jgi:hypothetical protein
VLPHPSQTKQEPAILILTPQVMQSGASDLTPAIFSNNSIDDPTDELSTGAFSIFTSCFLLSTFFAGAEFAAGFSSAVYSPLSSARARSAAE